MALSDQTVRSNQTSEAKYVQRAGNNELRND